MKFKVKIIFVLLIAALLNGCILAPFIGAFKSAGATEGDRKELLPTEVQRFTESVSFGNRSTALSFVLPDNRKQISEQLKKMGEEEKIFESKVDDIEWSDGAWNATVVLKTKFFRVPFYIVKTRTEEQKWDFSFSGGWKLRERSVTEE